MISLIMSQITFRALFCLTNCFHKGGGAFLAAPCICVLFDLYFCCVSTRVCSKYIVGRWFQFKYECFCEIMSKAEQRNLPLKILFVCLCLCFAYYFMLSFFIAICAVKSNKYSTDSCVRITSICDKYVTMMSEQTNRWDIWSDVYGCEPG